MIFSGVFLWQITSGRLVRCFCMAVNTPEWWRRWNGTRIDASPGSNRREWCLFNLHRWALNGPSVMLALEWRSCLYVPVFVELARAVYTGILGLGCWSTLAQMLEWMWVISFTSYPVENKLYANYFLPPLCWAVLLVQIDVDIRTQKNLLFWDT